MPAIARALVCGTVMMVALVASGPGVARAQPTGPVTALPPVGSPAPGAIPPPAPEDEQAARDAFARGNDALREARFPEAAGAYREALRRWDHPCIHYNLALALVNLDEPVALLEALEHAVGLAGAGGGCFAPSARALQLVSLARRSVADLEVDVPHQGARLFLDDTEVFTGPGTWRARVAIGRHTLRAEAPGMEPSVEVAFFPGGETTRLTMQLYTLPISDYFVRKPLPRWAAYTIASVGIEAAVLGLLLHQSARSLDDDYRRQRAACAPADLACPVDPALLGLRDAAHARRGAAVTLYGAGAALAIVGVAILVYERPRAKRVPMTDLVPVVGDGQAGLAVVGRF